jgi:hypothetical protein
LQTTNIIQLITPYKSTRTRFNNIGTTIPIKTKLPRTPQTTPTNHKRPMGSGKYKRSISRK